MSAGEAGFAKPWSVGAPGEEARSVGEFTVKNGVSGVKGA